MTRFKATPYFHLAYRLIPGYPITSRKVLVNGITFDGNGEFETDDEVLIRGLRLYIKYAKNARELPQNALLSSVDLTVISEVMSDEKAAETVQSIPVKVIVPETTEDTDSIYSEIRRLLKR